MTGPLPLMQALSLFLDFDGTLVELAPEPQGVAVSDDLSLLLRQCRDALDGRLALVSGRSAAELQGFVGQGLRIVGSHGLEYLQEGTLHRPLPPDTLHQATAALRMWASNRPGVQVEVKPLGAALHYRQAPQWGDACRAYVASVAERLGLQFQPGSMVAELRAKGANKGDAVRRLMAEPPFLGTFPLFIGDDWTDEPAFEAVAALGGMGILVGQERPSHARFILPDVTSVNDWLKREIGSR